MIISEAPSEKDAIAGLLVAAAGGTVTNLTTTVAVSAADMKQCFAKAGPLAAKFRPPGK